MLAMAIFGAVGLLLLIAVLVGSGFGNWREQRDLAQLEALLHRLGVQRKRYFR